MNDKQNKEDIIQRLKQHYGFTTNAELANKLNVAPNTISGWIKRNSIDYDLILSKCEDINLNWILLGKIPDHEQAKEIDDDEFNSLSSNNTDAAGIFREYDAELTLLKYFHRKYHLKSFYADSLYTSINDLIFYIEEYDFEKLFSKLYNEFKIDKDSVKFQDNFLELYKKSEGIYSILKSYKHVIREIVDKLTDYIGYDQFKEILDKLEQEDRLERFKSLGENKD